SLDGQLVVLHPADHVEIQVRLDLSERNRGLGCKCGRTNEAELFARPESNQDISPPRVLHQLLADGKDGGDSRRVVVGTGMDLAHLRAARQRVAFVSTAQVVVVRAE